MTKKRNTLFIFALCASLWLSLPTVMADNSNIPAGYEALYHRLLEQKQQFLDDRADSIRNLNSADSWLNQINKALISSALPVRQKLISSRADMLKLKDQYHKDLEYAEEQLLNTEKDLAWIEGEMKHFACMK